MSEQSSPSQYAGLKVSLAPAAYGLLPNVPDLKETMEFLCNLKDSLESEAASPSTIPSPNLRSQASKAIVELKHKYRYWVYVLKTYITLEKELRSIRVALGTNEFNQPVRRQEITYQIQQNNGRLKNLKDNLVKYSDIMEAFEELQRLFLLNQSVQCSSVELQAKYQNRIVKKITEMLEMLTYALAQIVLDVGLWEDSETVLQELVRCRGEERMNF
ncbi:hypothetical protein FPQ18DRAFT_387759 [Pyronema domesticum]|nr:hypothetical protein FPQ18DRAFT_387759 [Pyronema domesticum]